MRRCGCSSNVAPERKLASFTWRRDLDNGMPNRRRWRSSCGMWWNLRDCCISSQAFWSSPASCVLELPALPSLPSLRVGAKSLQSTAATMFDGCKRGWRWDHVTAPVGAAACRRHGATPAAGTSLRPWPHEGVAVYARQGHPQARSSFPLGTSPLLGEEQKCPNSASDADKT